MSRGVLDEGYFVDMRTDEDFLREDMKFARDLERKCWKTPDCGCRFCEPQIEDEEDDEA